MYMLSQLFTLEHNTLQYHEGCICPERLQSQHISRRAEDRSPVSGQGEYNGVVTEVDKQWTYMYHLSFSC